MDELTTVPKTTNITPMLDIEPKMILEIASGVRDPAEIVEEYGFSPDQWIALQKYDPFIRLVDDKKAELKASGWTFKMKSALIAEELLGDLYVKATEEGASFHTTLELAKFTARAAGLDAPVREMAQAGSGFSIVIDLGGGKTVQIGSSQRTIEHEETYDFDETICFAPYTPTPLEKTA